MRFSVRKHSEGGRCASSPAFFFGRNFVNSKSRNAGTLPASSAKVYATAWDFQQGL